MNDIYRKTYAEINLSNLYENYQKIKEIVKDKTIIPVVKANAYGHGVMEVVRYLVENDVKYFAVSLLEEALQIRKEFKTVGILIMGVVQSEYFPLALEDDLTITISNFDQINNLDNLNKKLKVHLKIDTGMNRLGFKTTENILKAFNILKTNDLIDLEGIYTHFATADDNKAIYDKQFFKFKAILKMLHHDFKMIHMSNSSSMIKYENLVDFTTHARLGISLYGLTLDSNTTFLKNTYRLISHIAEIKYLNPGDKVGYGATYTAQKKEIIGILPLGYADGFIRQNQGGDVEINNKRYKIIGRICMDQMFIRIDDLVTIEDDVILFGGLISIDEVAKRLKTINYEIICQITNRVPKIYLK